MTDQEWNRICNQALIRSIFIWAILVGVPVMACIPEPKEFAVPIITALESLPIGAQAILIILYISALIAALFPPRKMLGRGVWSILAVGLFGCACYMAATDIITDEGTIAGMSEAVSNGISVLFLLAFCICIAGIMVDGPRSWERRYNQSNTGEIARR